MKNKPKFTPLHRALHWTIAIAILFMFITVFLRYEWMNSRFLADLIAKNLAAKGITPPSDTESIARPIMRNMFKWHIYVGYVLVGLFVIRLLYLFIKGAKFPPPFAKGNNIKRMLQGGSYIVFYVFLAAILISGLTLKFTAENFSYRGFFQEVHKISFYIILAFVVVHFIGIYIGEKTEDKGITSKMISGHDFDY